MLCPTDCRNRLAHAIELLDQVLDAINAEIAAWIDSGPTALSPDVMDATRQAVKAARCLTTSTLKVIGAMEHALTSPSSN